MSKLRAALIGTGNIARSHVRGHKAHADRTDLVAVLDEAALNGSTPRLGL
jgi:predicted dehydrogenase